MRALGIDLGSKRIGVALSDSAGALALPYEVLERGGDRASDHRRIAALVEETGAQVVVVGLPLSLDGAAGPAARAALEEVEELRGATSTPVEIWDERLSTVGAERALAGAGVRRATRRRVVDKVAAAITLQAWLDHRRLSSAGGPSCARR